VSRFTEGQPTWTLVGMTTEVQLRTGPMLPSPQHMILNRSAKPSAVVSSSGKCAKRSLGGPNDRQGLGKYTNFLGVDSGGHRGVNKGVKWLIFPLKIVPLVDTAYGPKYQRNC
jgi:hypothetical protein